MQVETYEVEPQSTEIASLAADGEAAMLIEQLGLDGQRSLVNQKTGTVCPYRLITAEEKAVFETLFPQKAAAKDYKSGPIPLRVLQCIAHVRELERADMAYLQVWYPKDGKDDPVLVARSDYYTNPIYLIARWGLALLPFEKLREMAIEKMTASAKAALSRARSEIEAASASVEDRVRASILGGEVYNPYVNV